MNKRLSKKLQWLKDNKLTIDDELYVGIDVHKKSYHVALWLNDAPAIDFVMPASNEKVADILSSLLPALRLVVYEAGPTGYGLASHLQKHNIQVKIAAPSKTPIQAAPESKTDRLDCRKLAKYAAKSMLRYITIPSKQQEADRQLCRLREQIVAKLRRVKIQIKSFLLQHDIKQPKGLSCWSQAAIYELSRIQLSNNLRYCLDELLQELAFIKDQLKRTELALKELFARKRHHNKTKILQTHPGVGPVIARQFATEIFSPKRFKHKTHLAKYVGLCPLVKQSGQSLRDGPISKTGRPQLRSNLIEAAWIWIRKDANAYETYNRIRFNSGHQNKAITAMARKLAINLWKMACDNKPYISKA